MGYPFQSIFKKSLNPSHPILGGLVMGDRFGLIGRICNIERIRWLNIGTKVVHDHNNRSKNVIKKRTKKIALWSASAFSNQQLLLPPKQNKRLLHTIQQLQHSQSVLFLLPFPSILFRSCFSIPGKNTHTSLQSSAGYVSIFFSPFFLERSKESDLNHDVHPVQFLGFLFKVTIF